jgi:hypothetical protein
MKKYIPVFLLFASTLQAQSISPLVNECAKKCSGSFTVTNNSLHPLNVVLQKNGFTVSSNGTPTLTPVPPGMDVALGQASAVLPIKGSHTFFYKVKCDTLPCHLQVVALFTNKEKVPGTGLKLALGLPTSIYVCEKKKDCRSNTLRSYGYDPTLQAKK